MNLRFLLLVLLCVQGTAWAQNTKSYFAFNLGASMPAGDYGDVNPNNDNAGYADVGPEVSIEGVYFFSDYVGFGAKFGNNVHFLDQLGYRNSLMQGDNVEEVYINYTYPYTNVYAQVGVFFNLPLTEQFHITPKVMGGMLFSMDAYIDAEIQYENGDYEYIDNTRSTSFTFTPLFGVDLRYVVSDDAMVQLSVDRISAKQDFGYDIYGNFTGKQQRYTWYTISLGVATLF